LRQGRQAGRHALADAGRAFELLDQIAIVGAPGDAQKLGRSTLATPTNGMLLAESSRKPCGAFAPEWQCSQSGSKMFDWIESKFGASGPTAPPLPTNPSPEPHAASVQQARGHT
jgi:hypothetical protein